MRKNIATTITFAEKKIFFTVIETIATQTVEVFSSSDSILNASPFLEKALKEANNAIGGNIIDVFVVVNPSTKTDCRIKPYVHAIDIAGDNVSKKDIDNAIALSKLNFESNDRRVTLVQPVKFEVFDVL